jgi:hypothetical protein
MALKIPNFILSTAIEIKKEDRKEVSFNLILVQTHQNMHPTVVVNNSL